jgi:hypothetical protein
MGRVNIISVFGFAPHQSQFVIRNRTFTIVGEALSDRIG